MNIHTSFDKTYKYLTMLNAQQLIKKSTRIDKTAVNPT